MWLHVTCCLYLDICLDHSCTTHAISMGRWTSITSSCSWVLGFGPYPLYPKSTRRRTSRQMSNIVIWTRMSYSSRANTHTRIYIYYISVCVCAFNLFADMCVLPKLIIMIKMIMGRLGHWVTLLLFCDLTHIFLGAAKDHLPSLFFFRLQGPQGPPGRRIAAMPWVLTAMLQLRSSSKRGHVTPSPLFILDPHHD